MSQLRDGERVRLVQYVCVSMPQRCLAGSRNGNWCRALAAWRLFYSLGRLEGAHMQLGGACLNGRRGRPSVA